jgi:hypothetical protein
MAKLFFRPDGIIEGLYTDTVNLQQLGKLHVTRATHVEFNETMQKWVVSLPDGEEVFMHTSREVALQWEKKYCESSLLSGYRVKEG